MVLFSIQTADILPLRKTYYASYAFAKRNLFTRNDVPYYKWISERLHSPLKKKSSAPVWCWLEPPDLRCSGLEPRGIRSACLQLEVPKEHVLVSQFEMWCWVLNGWRILKNKKEERNPSLSTKESWGRIFDLSFGSKSVWGDKNKRILQAIIPCIKPDWVTKIKIFIAR